MDIEVKFLDQSKDTLPISLGRNGDIKTVGVTIMDLDNQVVVQPITSSDALGKGFVGLPKNPEDLRNIAARLNELALDLETDHQLEGYLDNISTIS